MIKKIIATISRVFKRCIYVRRIKLVLIERLEY